jgi:hypothetical protein
MQALEAEASAMLGLNRAAQEELIRAGNALTQLAHTYTQVYEAAANTLVFGSGPLARRND